LLLLLDNHKKIVYVNQLTPCTGRLLFQNFNAGGTLEPS